MLTMFTVALPQSQLVVSNSWNRRRVVSLQHRMSLHILRLYMWGL